MTRFGILFSLLFLVACGTPAPPCPPATSGDIVYVTGEGWHAEIGIPAEELEGDLASFREMFPGVHTVMFGYGKKTFFTAPPETASEYILGPVPGPAAIHAMGLSVTPLEAYPQETLALTLPPGGAEALSNYISDDLLRDASGKPRIISRDRNPDGLFYAAKSRYSLLHTCNTWVADALHAAGLGVTGNGVMFSGQVMSRTREAASNQCPLLPGRH